MKSKQATKIKQEADKLIDKFNTLYPARKLLLFFVAGSHFFDLNTKKSDLDFKGIYLPSAEEFYNGESRRKMIDWKTKNKKGEKNNNEDIDCTIFSITKVFELLKNGDFNVMEMFFVPQDKIIIDSAEMKYYRNMRKSLLVNDISSFLGFIKKEYKRYGINAYHYKSQEDFLNFLQKYDHHTKLRDIWQEIEEYAINEQHIMFTESLTGNNVHVPSIKVAQRLYQNTVKVEYVRQALAENLAKYGHRQKQCAKAGVEFKGLYHALRLIYQANDLYDYGEFKIPFSRERHGILWCTKTSQIGQEKLFNLIDKEIENLYTREKTVSSNKHQVNSLIDKLAFKLQGQMKLKYIIDLGIVKKDGMLIYYIQNPSNTIKATAVKRNGLSIRYIKNPSEELQLLAIEENPWSSIYMKNMTSKAKELFEARKHIKTRPKTLRL